MGPFAIQIAGCSCTGFRKDVEALLKEQKISTESENGFRFYIIYLKQKKAFGTRECSVTKKVFTDSSSWQEIKSQFT